MKNKIKNKKLPCQKKNKNFLGVKIYNNWIMDKI